MEQENKDTPEKEPEPVLATQDELDAERAKNYKKPLLNIKGKTEGSEPQDQPYFDIKKTLGVAFAVSIVVVLLLSILGIGSWVTKKDFSNNLAMVNDTMATTTATINEKQATVDSAIQNIPSQITNAINNTFGGINNTVNSLSGRIDNLQSRVDGIGTVDTSGIQVEINNIKQNVNTLTNDIMSLTTSLAQLQSTLDALSDDISAVSERVTILEEMPEVVDNTKGAIKLEVDNLIQAIFTNTSEATAFIYLYIENVSEVELNIDNIIVNVGINSNMVSLLPGLEKTSIGYGTYYAEYLYTGAQFYYPNVRLNNLNMNIKPGSSRTLVLTYKIFSTNTHNTTVSIYPEVQLEEYELD